MNLTYKLFYINMKTCMKKTYAMTQDQKNDAYKLQQCR